MPNTHEVGQRRSAEMLHDPRYLPVVQTVQSEINRFRAGGGVAGAVCSRRSRLLERYS